MSTLSNFNTSVYKGKIMQSIPRHARAWLYTASPPNFGAIMTPVKQFTSLASLPLVLTHALVIAFLTLDLVMTIPSFS